MATHLSLKIDCKKIDKSKLFNSEKGASYLDAAIIMKDEPDQYGNIGMIVQNTSKEERDAGIKGAILGNVKYIEKKQSLPATKPAESIDDLPF